jgi:hypothetical protein
MTPEKTRKTRKRKVFERRTTGSATNQHRMRFTPFALLYHSKCHSEDKKSSLAREI